jgi:CRISPR-associated protein Csm3
MKHLRYKTITGKIRVKTGLHIGGSADTIEIMGNDNPVIKHPLSGEPYIPGSSLKGKMRSLLEWKLEKIERDGSVHRWCEDKECPICRIFGTSAGDKAWLGPTRLLVRDAHLTPEWRDKYEKEGLDLTERKNENSINRITAVANPRPYERVPAGVEFELNIGYRVFDLDDGGKTDEELFHHVIDGLRCVAMDALGGGGSRGSGRVEFVDLVNEKGEPIELT